MNSNKHCPSIWPGSVWNACVCVCKEGGECTSDTDYSLAVMPIESQRARTLLTALLWQPVLKQTLVSLCTCKCICVCVCVVYLCVYPWLCVLGRRPRQEREENRKGKKKKCVKLMYSVPCTVWVWATNTLSAVHDTTLAVGAVSGVHTLLSPRWRAEWVCGEPWPTEKGRLRDWALWPTSGALHWEGEGSNGCMHGS